MPNVPNRGFYLMTSQQMFRNSVYLFFLSSLILGCAGQQAPQGGPLDTDPPQIISTYPVNNTTHFTDNRIVIEFDEYVEYRDVEESIFISPYVGTLEFDWNGKEVEVRFSEKLKENKTYVVNIGTDVKDIRKNKMAQAFTLAFSTGDDIDHGAIEGRVFPIKSSDPPEGVMVFAYSLNDVNGDTLNPRQSRPDYITQTGKGGDFSLRHLAFGPYRVIAVRDEYRNLVYDPEADEFGIPAFAITLTATDTMQSNVWMQLAKEDTTAPRLIKITPQDKQHLLLEFSEPIDSSNVQPSCFQIVDTVNASALKVTSVVQVLPKLNLFLLVTEPQATDTPYRLTVDGVRDLEGISISALANSLSFTGSSLRDSIGPAIASASVADSARGIALQPEIQIYFSDIVVKESASGTILLQDSTQKEIAITHRWMNDASVSVQPTRPLAGKMRHTLRILTGKMQDTEGNRGKDSIRVVRFETVDPEILTGIEGQIADLGKADTEGSIYLFAESVGKKDPKSYQVKLQRPGAFAFQDILEGEYVLHAYRDRNENQKYNAGRLFPFSSSERFMRYPDTLKVRARWPLEGVRIIFR